MLCRRTTHGGIKSRSPIHPSKSANIPIAIFNALRVSDRVPDQVLNGVPNEVPDRGSDHDFSMLQENHRLDLHKHLTELN
jgi:hypothetical protein